MADEVESLEPKVRRREVKMSRRDPSEKRVAARVNRLEAAIQPLIPQESRDGPDLIDETHEDCHLVGPAAASPLSCPRSPLPSNSLLSFSFPPRPPYTNTSLPPVGPNSYSPPPHHHSPPPSPLPPLSPPSSFTLSHHSTVSSTLPPPMLRPFSFPLPMPSPLAFPLPLSLPQLRVPTNSHLPHQRQWYQHTGSHGLLHRELLNYRHVLEALQGPSSSLKLSPSTSVSAGPRSLTSPTQTQIGRGLEPTYRDSNAYPFITGPCIPDPGSRARPDTSPTCLHKFVNETPGFRYDGSCSRRTENQIALLSLKEASFEEEDADSLLTNHNVSS
ncbi:unnamed protein product [Protopolystoma xenopodis]|uniref:Uncharacterized protein n=1 Tax=Protopolystoma xenopodis TaxID=117903 RepID=A0A3S5A4G8_9PLAT|nr:unnamed protein product [Protopolystoma xenopodis]